MKHALILSLLLSGCVYGRGRQTEEPFDLDAELSRGGEQGAASPPTNARDDDPAWWTGFGVSELDALETRAAQSAPDLRTAEARVMRANALATQASAARYPTVSLNGSLSVGRSNSPVGGSIDSRSANVSLPIAWEVDLFARRANAAASARRSASASEADADGIALVLQAQVVEAYFDLVDVRSQRRLLEEDREADAHTSELVLLRFSRGLATAVDVEQARQQEIADDAQLSLLTSAETSARLRLATLLGRPPSTLPELTGSALPPPPADLGAQVHADLLAERPDLRAARSRVSAADHAVGSAIASRLPSIQLSFTPGYSSVRSESSFGNSTSTGINYTAAASLSAPLFDGFAGRARVDEQRANLMEAEAGYERALLGALVEVESTLALERDERAHHEALMRSVEVAERLVAAAQDRFRLGLSDFLPVLGALRSRTLARLALLASERRLLSLRVTLHRAVGGPLPHSAPPPSPEQEP